MQPQKHARTSTSPTRSKIVLEYRHICIQDRNVVIGLGNHIFDIDIGSLFGFSKPSKLKLE